jgi:hypothetical protein
MRAGPGRNPCRASAQRVAQGLKLRGDHLTLSGDVRLEFQQRRRQLRELVAGRRVFALKGGLVLAR